MGKEGTRANYYRNKEKWGWIGHTLRKPATNTTKHALSWNPQGKRKANVAKECGGRVEGNRN